MADQIQDRFVWQKKAWQKVPFSCVALADELVGIAPKSVFMHTRAEFKKAGAIVKGLVASHAEMMPTILAF